MSIDCSKNKYVLLKFHFSLTSFKDLTFSWLDVKFPGFFLDHFMLMFRSAYDVTKFSKKKKIKQKDNSVAETNC